MALPAEKRQHIIRISQPKAFAAGFHEDRRSVYWENGIPSKDYTKTTKCVLTQRQEKLVNPKQLHPNYIGDRPSPIWKISRAALSAPPSYRLSSLSKPKSLHQEYKPSRQVCPPISKSALSISPTRRLHELAHHKTYPQLLIKQHSEWDWGEWLSDISPLALKATPSSRLEELSWAKSLSKSYQPCRRVQWVITPSALQHSTTERVTKLACPKVISGYQEDFDPHTWRVSPAALYAQPSPCIENLAKPIPRKCRQKKGT